MCSSCVKQVEASVLFERYCNSFDLLSKCTSYKLSTGYPLGIVAKRKYIVRSTRVDTKINGLQSLAYLSGLNN